MNLKSWWLISFLKWKMLTIISHISSTFVLACEYSSLSSLLATKDARREARGASCIRRLLFVRRGKWLFPDTCVRVVPAPWKFVYWLLIKTSLFLVSLWYEPLFFANCKWLKERMHVCIKWAFLLFGLSLHLTCPPMLNVCASLVVQLVASLRHSGLPSIVCSARNNTCFL